MRSGAAFKEIKQDFEKLGYKVEGRKLISADYGVPQKRKRVIIIGAIKGTPEDLFPKILLEKNEYLTVKDAISDIPSSVKQDISEPVKLLKPKSKFQEFMRSQISVKEFLKSIK